MYIRTVTEVLLDPSDENDYIAYQKMLKSEKFRTLSFSTRFARLELMEGLPITIDELLEKIGMGDNHVGI